MSRKSVRALVAGATIAAMLGAVVPMFTFAAANGPTVTLISNSAQYPTAISDNPIFVAATVSTSTTDFNVGDVTAVNGTVTNFEGSGTSYSFDVAPSNPNDPDQNHRMISVLVNDNSFDSNAPSNTLTFLYDSTAASSTSSSSATSSPTVTITGGPADGSTIASGSDADFTFTVSDPSAYVECSLNGGSYGCASPQNWSSANGDALADGSYVFSVTAGNAFGTSTPATVNFTIGGTATSTGSGPGSGGTSTSTATSSPTFTPGPSGSPTITITGGPDNGATVTDGNADFTFTVSDASSTVMCSLGDAAATSTTLYGCTSPQNFNLGYDGNYAFEVAAGNAVGTSTIVSDFTVDLAATSSPSSTPTQTTSPSSASSGGNGPGPTPSGNGSEPGGPPSGNTVIPTTETTVAPAASSGSGSVTQTTTTTSTPTPATTPAPTISNSSGGSALVPTTQVTSPSTAPGVPNTGTDDTASTSDVSSSSVYTVPAVASTTAVGAAAASSGGSIPGWVWAVILLVILAALLWWAYSAGSTTDNPRA